MLRRTLIGGLAASATLPPVRLLADEPGLELSLCLDGSSSMFDNSVVIDSVAMYHHEIQRRGHVAALRDEEIAALLIMQRAHVQAIVWSEVGVHHVIAPLRPIRTIADCHVLADEIDARASIPPGGRLSTNHSSAVEYVMELSTAAARKRVIDISTDEPPDEGVYDRCIMVRDTAFARGFTINVLSIDHSQGGWQTKVLKGMVQTPDGFTLLVPTWSMYADSIRDKLLQEIRLV